MNLCCVQVGENCMMYVQHFVTFPSNFLVSSVCKNLMLSKIFFLPAHLMHNKYNYYCELLIEGSELAKSVEHQIWSFVCYLFWISMAWVQIPLRPRSAALLTIIFIIMTIVVIIASGFPCCYKLDEFIVTRCKSCILVTSIYWSWPFTGAVIFFLQGL